MALLEQRRRLEDAYGTDEVILRSRGQISLSFSVSPAIRNEEFMTSCAVEASSGHEIHSSDLKARREMNPQEP